MSAPASLPHQWSVRFASVYVLLHVIPYAFTVPYGEEVGMWVRGAIERPVSWFGETVLGFDNVVNTLTGSGDTAYDWSFMVLALLVSAVAATAWTALGDRRADMAKQTAWLQVALRYALGITMMHYGAVKLFPSQFMVPEGDRMLQSYGESSPMRLLWTYMGYSFGFNLFTGGVEFIGGLLLLFRRTSLLGAVVTTGALINVVAVNFAFDVPVKIFSSHLLIASAFLMWPHRHRLIAVLLSAGPAPAAPDTRPPMPGWLERARVPIKVVVIGGAMFYSLYSAYDRYTDWGRGRTFEFAGHYEPIGEGRGVDGVTRVVINRFGTLSLWQVPGDRATRVRYALRASGPTGAYELRHEGEVVGAVVATRGAEGTVVLVGNTGQEPFEVTLRPRPLPLTDRGFHWVSETPYNR